ncbi:MAG: ribosomal protein S18-alanine N-acetyltransferase [Clostridiales bacterium]|nr:ribosomal protein S18-alanine N-acetyltransferase [Clostridiales bacterium]
MLNFEKLNFENVAGVALLEKECFGKYAWSQQLLIEEINQENKHYIVVKKDNTVIAYGGFSQVLDEAHIMNIAVKSGYRKQGIAYKLLQKLIDLAKEKNISSMTLEVRESNIPARNLYEKHAFKLAGVRKGYYQDKENACIYWKAL